MQLPQSLSRHTCSLITGLNIAFLVFLASVNAAATKFSEEVMQNYLENDRAGLARLNSPYVKHIFSLQKATILYLREP